MYRKADGSLDWRDIVNTGLGRASLTVESFESELRSVDCYFLAWKCVAYATLVFNYLFSQRYRLPGGNGGPPRPGSALSVAAVVLALVCGGCVRTCKEIAIDVQRVSRKVKVKCDGGVFAEGERLKDERPR